ncbi:MAG: hypothetical protein KGI50_02875 [Patescibacteria group bacterium]|nr:hypothetical protein [Patescibacteria group bacterium]MDE2438549.1 hypothetical protein [Patescibacteria group bacterium]
MSEELMLDVGQANELKLAFRRAGFTNQEIKTLSEGDLLARVREVLRGHAEIKRIKHCIDLDGRPHIPSGWEVRANDQLSGRACGSIVWNPAQVRLHLSKNQQNGKMIEGNTLR